MDRMKFNAHYEPIEKHFVFVIEGAGNKLIMELSPTQYIEMATYLAKVGTSYINALKNERN